MFKDIVNINIYLINFITLITTSGFMSEILIR
jgi:hypothetical protein